MPTSRPNARPIRATRRAASKPPAMPVEVFLDGYSPAHRAIANRLRSIIKATIPEATERVRVGWRVVGFDLRVGRRSGFFAWVFPEREHVHLGFPQGVLLADPTGRLEGDGITKRARWLTYTSLDDIDEAEAIELIRAAAGVLELPPDAFG
ncbi:MAG TPA: DUF1801 domain-containing protein [Candidatus Limnocylindrales bacterium]